MTDMATKEERKKLKCNEMSRSISERVGKRVEKLEYSRNQLADSE